MLTEKQAAKIIKLNAPLLAMLGEFLEDVGMQRDLSRAKAAKIKLEKYIESLVEQKK